MKKVTVTSQSVDDQVLLEEIKKIFFNGGIVALPTDTVYGLGVLTSLPEAIQRLYEVKRRDKSKPLPICVARKEQALSLFSILPPYGYRLAEKFWPGPLTVVFYSKDGKEKIGVRVPDHLTLLKILDTLGEPIFLPSANLSGEKEAGSAEEVEKIFDDKIDLIIEAEPPKYLRPSTVVDLSYHPFKILREGVISPRDIVDTFIRKRIVFVCTGNTCRSPMAEHLLKKYLIEYDPYLFSRYEIISCGILAYEGMGASTEVARILREKEGIDIHHHSRRVTRQLLLSSDFIFTMEEKHKTYIVKNIEPLLEPRIFPLRKFLPPEEEKDIPDPVGKPYQFHLEVYELIRKAILELREWL